MSGSRSSSSLGPLAATTPLPIDRLCQRLGAGPVATHRQGMGWLLTEVIPVFVWAQISGALMGESFYLVTYLTLLGATAQDLALLPLVAYGGCALSMLLVFGRTSHDPKRRCVIDTGIGRAVWLGTIGWPLLGWYLEWNARVIIGGVFASIFICHVCHYAGGAAFSAWTQAVVPPAMRGRFWAWRNIASYGAVALAVLVMGLLLPKGADATPAHLPWLMGSFTVVTLVCLGSTWMLARAPNLPQLTGDQPKVALGIALKAHPGFMRLVVFNACSFAAMAITMPYLPTLLHQRGIGSALFAAGQGTAFAPAMLVGIFCAGWGLTRWGGHRLLVITAGLFLLADGCWLLLPADGRWWLGPCLALTGLAKGLWSIALIARSQELAPNGDSRFPALITGISAGCATVVALSLGAAVPLLAPLAKDDLPWLLVAIAVGLRLVAFVLLIGLDRQPRTTRLD